MGRKGNVGLQIMAVMVVFAGIAQWAWMFAVPLQYETLLSSQVNDFDAQIKSSAVKTHMEKTYINDSLRHATYQGLYQAGTTGFGTWTADSVPDWPQARNTFTAHINDVLSTDYLGTLQSGAGCSFNGASSITVGIQSGLSAGASQMVLNTTNPDAFRVVCESSRMSMFGGGMHTLESTENLLIPETVTVSNVRYQTLFNAARTVANDAQFRGTINTARESATVAVKTSCEAETRDRCGWNPPSLSFDDDDPLENRQEQLAADEVESRLDAIANRISNRFNGVSVNVTLKELEFRPHNINRMDQYSRSWRTGCVQSDSAEYTVSQPRCGMSSGACSSETCPLDAPGASCTDANVCPNVAQKPSQPPGEPAGDGAWTERVWTSSCGDDGQEDPFDYEERTAQDVAYRQATTLPWNVKARSAPAGPDGQSCDPYCEDSTQTCTETLGSTSQTQAAWSFDVESRTVVQVEITDTQNRIPTSDGFTQPTFVFDYSTTHTKTASQ